MRQIDPHHDYARCDGPLKCAYCGHMLKETGQEAYDRISAENKARGLRTAEEAPDPYARALERRGVVPTPTISEDDPRLVAMREFRERFYESALTSRMAAAAPAISDVHANPPDGYS